jgi:hypothetical protein
LLDINTVIISGKAKIFEGDDGFVGETKFVANDFKDIFGNRFGGTRDKEIVDLSEEEDIMALESSSVYATVVYRGFEIEVRSGED